MSDGIEATEEEPRKETKELKLMDGVVEGLERSNAVAMEDLCCELVRSRLAGYIDTHHLVSELGEMQGWAGSSGTSAIVDEYFRRALEIRNAEREKVRLERHFSKLMDRIVENEKKKENAHD